MEFFESDPNCMLGMKKSTHLIRSMILQFQIVFPFLGFLKLYLAYFYKKFMILEMLLMWATPLPSSQGVSLKSGSSWVQFTPVSHSTVSSPILLIDMTLGFFNFKIENFLKKDLFVPSDCSKDTMEMAH